MIIYGELRAMLITVMRKYYNVEDFKFVTGMVKDEQDHELERPSIIDCLVVLDGHSKLIKVKFNPLLKTIELLKNYN